MTTSQRQGPKYHKVYHRIWTDPAVRRWSDDERFTVLYLQTSPHRNTEGLYRLPVVFAMYDMGWDEARTTAALTALDQRGVIGWDPEADLVWLIEALETDPPVGPKQVQGAINRLSETPPSALRARYLAQALERCPDLAASLQDQLGWALLPDEELSTDTLCEGVCDTPAIAHTHSQAHSLAQTHSQPQLTRNGSEPAVDDEAVDAAAAAVAAEAAVVELADRLVVQAGILDVDHAPDAVVRRVRRALDNGWPTEQLEDLAADTADEATSSPLGLLKTKLRHPANNPCPAKAGPPGGSSSDESWRAAWAEAVEPFGGICRSWWGADLTAKEKPVPTEL